MSHRILIVDDEELQRRVLTIDLEAEGFSVSPAGSAEGALDSAKRSKPDLILLDVMLPGRDGFDCLRELKADPDLRDVPVIMLTARDGLDDELQGMAGGADHYLVKPIHRELLIEKVRAILESDERRS